MRRAAGAAARPCRRRRRRTRRRSRRRRGSGSSRAPSPRPLGATSVPSPGRTRNVPVRSSSGALEQLLRIHAQPLGRIARRRGRAHRRAAAGLRDDRLPADAAGEGLVAQDDALRGASRRATSGSSTRVVRRPPWPGGKRDRRARVRSAARPGARPPRAPGRAAPLPASVRAPPPARVRAPGRSGSRPGRGCSGPRRGRDETRTRSRWLTEKLPSGCACAAPGASAASSAAAARSSVSARLIDSAASARSARGPVEGREARVARQRAPQVAARARSRRPAALRGHARVVEERRVARSRAAARACAQRRPSRAVPERVSAQPSASAERTLGALAHARRASVTARAGLPWLASNSARSTSVFTPRGREQPLLGAARARGRAARRRCGRPPARSRRGRSRTRAAAGARPRSR